MPVTYVHNVALFMINAGFFGTVYFFFTSLSDNKQTLTQEGRSILQELEMFTLPCLHSDKSRNSPDSIPTGNDVLQVQLNMQVA